MIISSNSCRASFNVGILPVLEACASLFLFTASTGDYVPSQPVRQGSPALVTRQPVRHRNNPRREMLLSLSFLTIERQRFSFILPNKLYRSAVGLMAFSQLMSSIHLADGNQLRFPVSLFPVLHFCSFAVSFYNAIRGPLTVKVAFSSSSRSSLAWLSHNYSTPHMRCFLFGWMNCGYPFCRLRDDLLQVFSGAAAR